MQNNNLPINFELNFNGLMCKGNGLFQFPRFGDLWFNKINISFFKQLNLKNKNKS